MTDPFSKQNGNPKQLMIKPFILFITSFVKRLNEMV